MEFDEISLIRNEESMNADTLYGLRSLTSRYPYYQTARLLMVKNLFREKNADFGKELRKVSLFAADRRVLYYMIESGNPLTEPAVTKKKTVVKPVAGKRKGSDRTLDLIDGFLAAVPDDQPHRRLTLADATTDYAAYLAQQDDDETENSRSSETGQTVVMENLSSGNDNKQVSEDIAPTVSEKKVKESVEENYFTETLAKIYIKQGKYSRAIEIMSRLKADYPKKSSYFADQIRFLEKIIINNKNKT